MDTVNAPALDAALAHAGFVRGLARALLGADPMIDDVVQETWLAAARGSPRDPARMRGWLGGIVRRLSAGVYRKRAVERRHHPRVPARPDAPSTAEVAEKEEMRREVVEAMLHLREPSRSALLLRYYEDLPPRDVAARLGIPVETARTRIKRGLAQLRGELDRRRGSRAAWSSRVAGMAGLAPTAGIGAGAMVGIALLVAGVGATLFWGLSGGASPQAPPGVGSGTESAGAAGDAGGPGATLAVHGTALADAATPVPQGRCRIEGFVRRGGQPHAVAVALHYVGPPVAGFWARVAASRNEGSVTTQRAGRSAQADARGRYAIANLGVGTYVLSLAGAGASVWTRIVVLHADGLLVDGGMTLPGGGTGLAIEARYADGAPCSGLVRVSMRDDEKGSAATLNLVARTDGAGRVTLSGLPSGSVRVGVHTAHIHVRRRVDLPRKQPLLVTVGSTGAEIRGRVTAHATGAPVEGAVVRVKHRIPIAQGASRDEERTSASDADGRFVLPCSSARGEINVTVEAAGFAAHHEEWDRSERPLAIALHPEAFIAGHVVSRAGTAVSGVRVVAARVHAHSRYATVAGEARSDAQGRFAIRPSRPLRPGRYTVYAVAPGWASPRLGQARIGGLNPFEVEVEGAGPRDLELVVQPLPSVAGRVVDAVGEPVVGVQVHASYAGAWGGDTPRPLFTRSQAVATDAHGRFVLSDLVPGMDWTIEASGPGILPVSTPRIGASGAAGPLLLRATRLDAGRDLVVEVRDAADGRPIEGVHVRVVEMRDGGYSSIRGLGTTTDRDGKASLSPVPATGAGVLLGGAHVPRDHAPTSIPAGDGQTVRMLLRVPRTYEITGTLRVVPDGLPPYEPHVRVEATPADGDGSLMDTVRGRCDGATGRWSVGGLTRGRWRVELGVHGHTAFGVFEAGNREAQLELNWPWKRANEAAARPEPEDTVVRYLVTGPDGAKVPRATFGSWIGGGFHSGGPVRDGERVMRYGTGIPREVVEVYGAQDDAGARLPYGAVVLAPGSVRAGDNPLTLPHEMTIEGRVTVGGKPVTAGVRVRASVVVVVDGEDRTSKEAHDETTTDAGGRFRLRGLGPYRYALVVAGSGGLQAEAPVVVDAGTSDVEIAQRASVTATIVLLREDGTPLAGIPVQALVAGEREDPFPEDLRSTDVQGRLTLDALDPDQRYRLLALARPYKHGVFGLERKDWSPQDETFRLPVAHTISGVVRAPDQAPVAKAEVLAQGAKDRWSRVATADEEGRFTVWGVPAGGLMLRAGRGKQRSDSLHAAAGAKDLVLALDPGIDFAVRASSWPWGRLNHAHLSYLALDAAGARLDGSNWGSPGISQGREAFVGRARDATWSFFWTGMPEGKIGWLEGARPEPGAVLEIPILNPVVLTGRMEIPEGVSHEQLSVRVRLAITSRGARPAADGTFRVEGLPPAELEVRVLRVLPTGKRLEGPPTRARPGEPVVLQVPTE